MATYCTCRFLDARCVGCQWSLDRDWSSTHAGISSQKATVQQIKGIFRCFCLFMWLALHSSLGASCLIASLIKKENQFHFTRFPREIAEVQVVVLVVYSWSFVIKELQALLNTTPNTSDGRSRAILQGPSSTDPLVHVSFEFSTFSIC